MDPIIKTHKLNKNKNKKGVSPNFISKLVTIIIFIYFLPFTPSSSPFIFIFICPKI